MAFDLATAKPVTSAGFDLATAKPVEDGLTERQRLERKMLTDRQAQMAETAKTGAAPPAAQSPGDAALSTVTSTGKLIGGLGETAAQGATGTLATLAGQAVKNVVQRGKDFGLTDKNPDDVKRAIQEAATYQPRTETGKKISEGVGYLPGKIREGVVAAGNVIDPKVGEEAGDVFDVASIMAPGAKVGRSIESSITHAADETGRHTIKSPNGESLATETAHGRLQVTRDDTNPAARGKGEGAARIERVIAEAERRNLIPESGTSVSPGEAKIWKEKMAARGYKVKENPSEPGVNGNLVSKDAKKGVFEVEMTPTTQKLAAAHRLLAEDVRLTTEQRGDKTIHRQAGSAGRAADTLLGESHIREAQRQDFTRAALRKVDINIEPEAIADARPALAEVRKQVEAKYEDLTTRVPTKIDPALLETMVTIGKRAKGDSALGSIARNLEILQEHSEATPDGVIVPGKTAQEVRADLGRLKGSADTNLKHYASTLQRALDDAYERTAPPEDAAAMKDVRLQFHRMKLIEPAIEPDGTISPAKLYTSVSNKRNRPAAVYGKGDQALIELSRDAKMVLPDKVGNTGTATRGADITKIAVASTHPILALKAASGVLGGRLINEGNAKRGTATAIKEAEAKRPGKELRQTTRRTTVGGVSAASNVSPEERKRRLQAEALRNK